MRITISGPPGSGKTTVTNILSERLGYKAIVFGKLFRQLAEEKGMTLSELGDLAENDPSIDEMIDSKIVDIARKSDDTIFESRLSAYMLSRNGVDAFKVYLDASLDVRVGRVGLRDGETIEEAKANTLDRQRSEAKRYMMYYDIDIQDTSVYDLIVNTDHVTPEQVADAIMEGMS